MLKGNNRESSRVVSIRLTNGLYDDLEEAVKKGHYTGHSEFIKLAIRERISRDGKGIRNDMEKNIKNNKNVVE